MRTLIALLASALFATLTAGSVLAFPNQKETFSHRPELGVLVLTSTGEKLPGATLELCRSDVRAGEKPCRSGVADQDGELVFKQVAPGEYRLTVSMDGFVSTSVGPLNVNMESSGRAMAPDRVVVILNAECYDC